MRTWGLALMAGCSFSIPLEDVRPEDSGEAQISFDDMSGGGGGGSDSEDPPPCGLSLDVLLPEDGATDAHYRDPLRVQLSAPDPSANIVLRTLTGESVAGTTAAREESPTAVEFHPTEPLIPLTEYRASATFCEATESVSWTFTTSAAGQPLTVELTGRAHLLELESARWMRPAIATGLVSGLFEEDVLLGVGDASGGVLQSTLVPGLDGVQDHCGITSPLPAAALSDGWVSLSDATVVLSIRGELVVLYRTSLSGDFLPDGGAIAGGRLAATVDLRQVVDLLSSSGSTDTPEELCAQLALLGTSCEPCTDGVEVCYDVELEGITASEVDGPLSCVALDDCHPACADSTCADPTAGECSG